MEKRFFTIKEATTYSAQGRTTLYDAHKHGELTFTKFGNATRIEKADLDAYLNKAGVKSQAQVAA
ncbi:Helix-turn-helix domain protein [Roseovarius albus]|uniref:Helix-turn-helix domain protein n=1 Tax=Roseovarius albus TaxID=1247867 RepID=A0A1X6ZX66_9RHOB|nr:helix-turn-helix domain-containing protein [Roseovarius albus]SLN64134.1 Helix-turn-helix domain protein [Roseovarius albus]